MSNDTFPIQPMTKFLGFNLNITLLMAFDLISGIIERFGADHTPGSGSTGHGCVYAREARDGVLTPVCIVGQMFADLGILRVLTTNERGFGIGADPVHPVDTGLYNVCGMGPKVREHLKPFGITIEQDAWDFLCSLQWRQDNGDTWGSAFEQASDLVIENGHVLVTDSRTAVQKVRETLDD